MPWFIKTETFRRPRVELEAALNDHRLWVRQLQGQGLAISSGYLVDDQGRPGGGGLLLLEASDHAEALALIQQDPLIAGGWVDWTLQGWIPSVGSLATSL